MFCDKARRQTLTMTVLVGEVSLAKSNVAKGFCFCYREPWPDSNSLVDRVDSVAMAVTFENPWNITYLLICVALFSRGITW